MRTMSLVTGFLSLLVLAGSSTAQKSAFTADGDRVYLYDDGTWSTDPDRAMPSSLLRFELQQERQSETSEDRCTLIFGLNNNFATDLKEVQVEVQFLDEESTYLMNRRISFKNPRAGRVRFSEVPLRLPQGCKGYADFDVVDVPRCRTSDGVDLEGCFDSLVIKS